MDGMAIGPSAAACGTAAWRRAPVLSRDIAVDPLWGEHRALMAELGLRAAWSTPVLCGDGSVLATLALYSREARLPNEWEMRVIDVATALSGLAIQRTQGQQQVVESEARYRALAENAFDLVCELDSQGRFAYVSPNFKDVLGYEPAELLGHERVLADHADDQARVSRGVRGRHRESAPPAR